MAFRVESSSFHSAGAKWTTTKLVDSKISDDPKVTELIKALVWEKPATTAGKVIRVATWTGIGAGIGAPAGAVGAVPGAILGAGIGICSIL